MFWVVPLGVDVTRNTCKTIFLILVVLFYPQGLVKSIVLYEAIATLHLVIVTSFGGKFMKIILIITLFLSLFLISSGRSAFCGDSEFYHNLEHLLYNYGNDPENWPDCEQKKQLSTYTRINYGKSLNECKFGDNLLVYGISNSPHDAVYDLAHGKYDAWGKPYDLILASSPDGNAFLDWPRAVGNNLGEEFYNKNLMGKLLVFLKGDFHSQGAITMKNYNGIKFTILAREVNIMGDPGSFYKSYIDDISRSLSVAHCMDFRVWVGGKDNLTKIFPNLRTAKERGLSGLIFEMKIGDGSTRDRRTALKDAGHPLHEYGTGIQGRPVYVLKSSKTSRKFVEDDALLKSGVVSKGDYASPRKWNKTREKGDWVVVSEQGESVSEGVAILMTKPDDSPTDIARKIRERNDREHPGEQAIILLDGNPNSDSNRVLAKALREKGYEDIFIVWDGNLYTTEGECVAHGRYFLPKGFEKDSVLAQGMWGHILRVYSGRPVYGDPMKREPSSGSPSGILINPSPVRCGRTDTGVKRRVIQSRPSGDSLSWPVTIPVTKEKKP